MATREKAGQAPGFEFYGGYEVYSQTGIDLTQLRRNLARSFDDRCTEIAHAAQRLTAWTTENPNAASTEGRGMFDPGRLVQCLTENNVEFVVIGGLAMATHGSAFVTMDLDIRYLRTPANLAALASGLSSLHPRLRGAPADLPFRLDAPTLQAGLNFTLVTDLGDVDLIGEVPGVGAYEQVVARSVDRTLFGAVVRVLSIDGLIASKKAAGRAKDQAHLLELEEIKKLQGQAPVPPKAENTRGE